MSHVASFVVLLAVVGALAPGPARAGTVSVAETVIASATVGERVNINTADVKELMRLSGVSRSLAERIVKYRDANGQFKKPADLRKVDGVGDALWDKNRARIVVR